MCAEPLKPSLADRAITRRNALKRIGAGMAAGALLMGGSVFWDTPLLADPIRPPTRTLAYFDLTYVSNYDLRDPQQAAMAYDHMLLVATLQGNVNRGGPRLYVSFVNSDKFGSTNVDDYWLHRLRAPGEWLAKARIEVIPDLDTLLWRFRDSIRGAVVYDSTVPATVNVATTVAGVEDLIAVRYDAHSDSLYSRYISSPGVTAPLGSRRLPVHTWLVQQDGSPLFTGKGRIPDTNLPSTGSAKNDAYIWAKNAYLDNGRCTPGELSYYLDAFWLQHPQSCQQAVLLNRDYAVSRRAFVFDLSPWDDELPVDDPTQMLGTDVRTLQAILLSSYKNTEGGMTAIHGFVPWRWKYTKRTPPVNSGTYHGQHPPYSAEWQFVKIISAYNAYLDADAEGLDGMANASVYQHYPLAAYYQQNPRPTLDDLRARGYLRADGSVTPKRYVMLYVGDYDSAAWLYHAVRHIWDDPNRGAVPLNWAFNPNLAQRIAPALVYTRKTRTANDFFIAGDSGAGYLNPGMLQEPRQYSRLPSGLDAWAAHCRKYYQQWGLSITGLVIDGFAPGLNEEGLAAYRTFSPDGLAAQKFSHPGLVAQKSATLGKHEDMPYMSLGIDLPGQPSELIKALNGDTSKAPLQPEFHEFRSVLQTPTWYKNLADGVHSEFPHAEVEFVDAYTFYALVRQFQASARAKQGNLGGSGK